MSTAELLKPVAHREAPLWQERQRLATFGGSVLSDRELLALAVGSATAPGCDVHALVARLLARYGSVEAIATAHPAELAVAGGLGPATAAGLSAAFELARRSNAGEPPEVITEPSDVARVARPLLHGQARERVVVVICSRRHRVIGCEVIAQGAAERVLLPVRETLVAVLRRDGQALALAHNHPSGDPTPSELDVERTVELRHAADATGLRFLGHVVVADTRWRVVPVGPAGAPTGRSRAGR